MTLLTKLSRSTGPKILLGSVVIVCVSFIGLRLYRQKQLLSSSLSPANRYKVEIVQGRGSFGFERWVYLNAYRNKEQFVWNKLLYTGDFLDGDFRDLYPNHTWTSGNILKIGQGVAASQLNNLKITNATPSRINYLLVETYSDKYVLFDIEPESEMALRFKFLGRLSCQGEFAESKERFGEAAMLADGTETEVRGDFTIQLKEKDVVIGSPNLNMKRVTCCAVDRPDIKSERLIAKKSQL